MSNIVSLHVVLRVCAVALSLTFASTGSAAECFVSPLGDDSGGGGLKAPWKTIARGVSALKAGDTLYLLEGRYHEEVNVRGLRGEPGRPIAIRSWRGAKAVLDGTVALKNLKWTPHPSLPHVWQAKIDQDVWQLFVDGRMRINARWPNAEHPFENEERSSWWDRGRSWRKVQYEIGDKVVSGFDFERAAGFLVDDGAGHGLAALDRSAVGLIGVLNVNSMDTLVGRISKHEAGSAAFEYEVNQALQDRVRDPAENNLRRILTKNASHAYYYLEGWADLIDTPDEWAYDKATKTLFLYAKNAAELENADIRGKTQSTALRFADCSYVTVQGLTFFATCLQAVDCTHLTVEDNLFDYPSYSKRMLGSLEDIEVMTIERSRRSRGGRRAAADGDTADEPANLPKGVPPEQGTYNLFRNNVVRRTDGRALHLDGGAFDMVDNNLFRYIDISGAPGGSVGVWATGWRNAFTHNTLEICGSSKATKCGDASYIALNRISRFGYLQDDGTAFQTSGKGQQGTIYMQNWVHDSPKSGLRFDGSEDADAFAKGIYNGSMVRNVVFNNNGGLMVKGDDHRVYNNLCYNIESDAYKILTSSQSRHSNHETMARNNMGDYMNASRRDNPLDNPPPGSTDHNWVNLYPQRDIRGLLRDPDNLDFRPRAGASEIIDAGVDLPSEKLRCGVTLPDFTSAFTIGKAPDIGAYEFGAKDYWIAGYRGPKASTPVPPDGCLTAKPDADLMWLAAYRADSFRVYLGTDPASLAFVSEQTNNIYNPGPLDPTLTYYWRVDCRTPDGWSEGDVWRFRPRGRPFRKADGVLTSYVATFREAYDFDQDNLGKNARGLLMPWIGPKYNADHLDIRNGAMEIRPNFSRSHDFEPVTIPNVNLDLAPYPFLSFRYKTTSRSKPIGFYAGYEGHGGASQQAFPKTPLATLTPSPDGFTPVWLSLESVTAEGKRAFGSTVARDFLIQINGPTDAAWGRGDGVFIISDFRIGFARLLEKLKDVTIVGQRGPIASSGQPVIISPDDLRIAVSIESDPKQYAVPPRDPLPEGWTLHLTTGSDYTVVDGDTVKPAAEFKGVLRVPAVIKTSRTVNSPTPIEIEVK
jgi:hypothetical protein